MVLLFPVLIFLLEQEKDKIWKDNGQFLFNYFSILISKYVFCFNILDKQDT